MQELIVLVLVTAATLYLGLSVRRTLRGRRGCGSCAAERGCPSQTNKSARPFDV